MKLRLYIIIALVATALSAMARAYAPEDLRNVHLDNRTRYVTNPDGVLSPGAVTRLDSMLAHVWRTTTAEPLVVAIDDMAPGYDEVTFANDLFDLWKPGKKDTNNGLILLIVKNPRRYTVRTGYGLEGVLTDGNCGSVMRRYAVPEFKKGDYDAGTIAAVGEFGRILEAPDAAEYIRSQYASDQKEEMPLFSFMLWAGAIAGVAMLLWVLMTIFSTRRLTDRERYQKLNNIRPVALFASFAGLGFPLPAYLICVMKMKSLRDHRRACPNCGTQMKKLDEVHDNDYLTPAQDMEEQLNSIDYDVWLCPQCGEKDVIPYVNRSSAFTTCPVCGARACTLAGNRIIVQPTTQREGRGERIYSCRNCRKNVAVPYNIAKIATPPVVIFPGGGFGGGFGRGGGGGISGGSMGGGITGGGGASGGW